MRYKHLVFLTVIYVLLPFRASAQKTAVADSVWCDNLNDIIRCASLDLILEPVAKDVKDSSYIPTMMPRTRLSRSAVEMISKQYNKVNYMCYLYSAAKPDKNLEAQFEKWHKKIKDCLSLWDDAPLPNGDKSLSMFEDRFLTNSEDETMVRPDIVKGDGYHVRIRIY